MNQQLVDIYQKDILIVDDNPSNIRILAKMLTAQGYNIRKALSGQMALTACQTVLPNLILLDIMMPEMDGYQVCQHLKSNHKTCDIPVIFISALDEPLDKVKAFNVGGVDYITKPFQIEEVLARVVNQLTIQHLYHKLKHQNFQLQQLNEDLVRANTELQQFAYAASHDLQSPLQGIVSNADLIRWKYKDTLNEDVNYRINRIINAGMRMKQLIQDLLAYSRLEKSTQEFKLTDCKIVLEEALANLQEDISSSNAEIHYCELPIVMGDDTQLMRLFQNLISNSIKFRRPEVPPQIKISVELHPDSKWLIGVHDNGIGIEEKHFQRIFEIFQRLHTAKEYPGTGIGMSICKKIVELHGGQIWVESNVGSGSCFYFTIPDVNQ